MAKQTPSTTSGVNIRFPGAKQRAEIWRRALPAAVAREPLDYPFLARFTLTGRAIRDAALGAASLARGKPGPDGPVVTMEHVLQAIRVEYRKLEKPVNEADFKWLPLKAHGSQPAEPAPAWRPSGPEEPVAAPD